MCNHDHADTTFFSVFKKQVIIITSYMIHYKKALFKLTEIEEKADIERMMYICIHLTCSLQVLQAPIYNTKND